MLGLALYLDSINGAKLSGNVNGSPVQIFRDGSNYVQFRSLIEFFGGSVATSPNEDGTYEWTITVDGNTTTKYFTPPTCDYSTGTESFLENDRSYMKLRSFVELIGYGDVMSWWNKEGEAETTILVQPKMLHGPIIATRAGDKFNVLVYADFAGDIWDKGFIVGYDNSGNPIVDNQTYAEAGMLGILEHLQKTVTADGTMDVFDGYKTMSINVGIISSHETKSGAWTVAKGDEKQNYQTFNINSGQIWSNTSGYIIDTSTGIVSIIGYETHVVNAYDQNPLKNGTYTPFTKDGFMWMMSHEFAHILGIGDASVSSGGEKWTLEVPDNGLMSAQGGVLTANEVEMILLAWASDNYQRFYEYALANRVVPRSSAIRSGF
jgi:hypothetical protein